LACQYITAATAERSLISTGSSYAYRRESTNFSWALRSGPEGPTKVGTLTPLCKAATAPLRNKGDTVLIVSPSQI